MGLEKILKKIATGELNPIEAIISINPKQLELFKLLQEKELTVKEVQEEFAEC